MGSEKLRSFVESKTIEKLDMLERIVIPLAYVPKIGKKATIIMVADKAETLKKVALESFESVKTGCHEIMESDRLLELCYVMLQMATYVANFGETNTDSMGFSLTQIQEYATYKLGKCSFINMVAIFLLNMHDCGGKKRQSSVECPNRSSKVSRHS